MYFSERKIVVGLQVLKNNPFNPLPEKPLILDGAMGSYVQQKGFEIDDVVWTTMVNLKNPDLIIQIHKEYINAGADIITTNTFRTNPASLKKSGLSSPEKYVMKAVSLAIQAADSTTAMIAGSNAPAEDCYQVERKLNQNNLQINHRKHIDLLIDSGVDFILNETQSHLDEIMIICQHCDKNSIPYVLSLYVDENLNLLSGENVKLVLNILRDHNPIAIGFNCITPDIFNHLIRSTTITSPWGYYLNCGSGNPTDKMINCGIQPDEYINSVKNSLAYKPVFIGSCCGSNPAHTKKIREFVDEQIYS